MTPRMSLVGSGRYSRLLNRLIAVKSPQACVIYSCADIHLDSTLEIEATTPYTVRKKYEMGIYIRDSRIGIRTPYTSGQNPTKSVSDAGFLKSYSIRRKSDTTRPYVGSVRIFIAT